MANQESRSLIWALVMSTWLIPTVSAWPMEARVLSSAEKQVPDPTEKLVLQGTTVTLHLAVKKEGVIYSASSAIIWESGQKIKKSAHPQPGWKIRWFKIEVSQSSLSNTFPRFHWENIPYREVAILSCNDQWSCTAAMRATILGDREGLGTMAFRATASFLGEQASSPGAEQRWRGGLTDQVARVTVRPDNSYLGFLTELFNTPYIWGSAGEPASIHQTERRIGSDCADFVTYGVRRMGHSIPYTSTWTLPNYAREIAVSAGPRNDGLYYDPKGRPISFGAHGAQPGDLLLFPGHVGALAVDKPPLGLLSISDTMIHTCWAEPIEQPIAQSSYHKKSVRVLRWKVFDHSGHLLAPSTVGTDKNGSHLVE